MREITACCWTLFLLGWRCIPLQGWPTGASSPPDLCVNDLEAPAFAVMPALAELKARLARDSGGRFSAVFMTGASGRCGC